MFIIDVHRSRQVERGVTFIEMIIFIVIVSFAIAGILLVINNTTQRSADPQLRKQALAIAESLLEEIELARFTYCNPTDPQAPFATTAVWVSPGTPGSMPVGSTPNPGYCKSAALVENFAAVSGARPYGNVINYTSGLTSSHSTTYSSANGTLVDANGNAIPYLTAGTFTATVTINNGTALASSTNLGFNDPGANPNVPGALQITVSVAYPQGVIVLDGYRTQYAPQLMP